MTVFVSAENVDDRRPRALIEALRARGYVVEHSPRSPNLEPERWRDWYGRGCADATRRASVVVTVVTDGWDGSTWMAHEAQTAIDLERQLLCWNPDQRAIPVGMVRYAQQTLPLELEAAVASIAQVEDAG
jgi:hypothetical protein